MYRTDTKRRTSAALVHDDDVASPLAAALQTCRTAFLGVGLFSGIVNLLALVGSLYMLQLYDRVLPSKSVPTLVGLTLIVLVLFVACGMLDHIRMRLLSRVGQRIDSNVRGHVFSVITHQPLARQRIGDPRRRSPWSRRFPKGHIWLRSMKRENR